jgi:DNA-binding MarR family transcriptional regulator
VSELIAEQHRGNRPAPMLALNEAPGHLIRRAQQRHTMLWTQEFSGDLTGPQYAVVRAVGGDEGLDQRAVGELASLDKSSTADIVARLHGQGWLRFSRDPSDGRRKTLTLTPLARTALGEITRRVGLVQERLLEPVPVDTVDGFLEVLRLVAYAGSPPSAQEAPGSVPTLRNTPGHLIRRTQQVHTLAWGAEVGRRLTAPQYAVLSALWGHPEGIDQSTGGEVASLDKSSMADVVQRLVKRGWVARTRDPEDARRRLLSLTDNVREDLLQLTPAVQRVQDRMMEPLVDEQRGRFLRGCRALAHPDDPERESPDGRPHLRSDGIQEGNRNTPSV